MAAPSYRKITAYEQPVDNTIGVFRCPRCGRLQGDTEGDVCYGGPSGGHDAALFVRRDFPNPYREVDAP